MPVLGSGHPQADVFLLKFAPAASEIEEGVAFYGRSGTALMKSLKRLGIDPLAVYGTLCVKCPVGDAVAGRPGVHRARARGAGHRGAQDRGGHGRGRAGRAQRPRRAPGADRSTPSSASCRPFTPACDALVVPNIDEALDEEAAKREFWSAFRVLGEWYADLPPY